MIVTLSQLAGSCMRNRVWLASLGAAAAINFGLFWLASIAPMGRLPAGERAKIETPVQIVMRRRAPPPPDLNAMTAAESPPSALPPRFRPRIPVLQALPDFKTETILPGPRLRLDLNPCDPMDEERMRAPECAASQDWLRADRDASELFGPETKGLTLDEYAYRRGWKVRKLPNTRLDSMTGRIDSTLPDTVFKDSPF